MKKFYFIILVLIFVGALFWLQDMHLSEQQYEPVLTDHSAVTDVPTDKLPAEAKTSGNGLGAEPSAEGFVHGEKTFGNELALDSSVRRRPRGRLADPEYRAAQVRKKSAQFKHEEATAIAKAKREGWYPLNKSGDPGRGELMAIKNGKPLVNQINNVNAAISTAASFVRDNPIYGVDGSNTIVGVWDAGSVRSTHQEFGGRVSLMDAAAALHYHSTHVAGTIAASGVSANAKGMATAVKVESYDWNNDLGQMTSRAMAAPDETDKLQISNHSYGYTSGWNLQSSPVSWYGTWGAGIRESDSFGIYSAEAAGLDSLCYDAPYYLIVKSAGNDRSDSAPSSGTIFQYYNAGWRTKTYNPATDPLSDYAKGGYDTVAVRGNAKNILTVGSVNDAVSGGNRVIANAIMAPYSGWGPADDGRIKPDIVANGQGVYSTDSGSNNDYRTLQGTSMSAPNAAGSAALLVEYYKKLFIDPISSALLKGLIIHTADDLGLAGPDYMNGWGLMNTELAAEYIRLHHEYPVADIMYENLLDGTNISNTLSVISDGLSPLKATICWTDPAGNEQTTLNNRTPVLVNDLDLRVMAPNGGTNFPFILNVDDPSAPATTGNNIVDNMEQVIISAPVAGEYLISISYKGVLTGSAQYYALIIGGVATAPVIEHDSLVNTTNSILPYLIEATVNALEPLKENGIWLFWSTNDFISAAESNVMSNISSDMFSASIPAQPLGADISYYIYAETTKGLTTTHPATAPVTVHSFIIVPPVNLDVWGSPSQIGIVNPAYGASTFPSGTVVHATASLFTPESAGHRYASAGWLGANDVPAEGSSNNVSFLIERNSAMFWRWNSEYSLLQAASVSGMFSITNWWIESSFATSVTAQVERVQNSTSYHFAEWQVDGVRQPDSSNIAVNPVTDLLMETSHVATAIYLPVDQDSDNDGLPDWWERYYFGSLDQTGGDDPDNDGYLNLEEFEDGSNPRDPLSFPVGPTISHAPLASIQSNPAPWNITAEVIDNNDVGNVVLRWRRNGLNWRQTAMVTNSMPDQYSANLPAPGLLGDSFEYMIQATDMAGYYSEDGPHNIFVAYSVIDIVQTNMFDFVMLKNITTNTSFAIGNNGNTNLDFKITMESVGLWDDMESGTNEWTHGINDIIGVSDKWHISTNRYFSSSNSWYCGDEISRKYLNGAHASLVTPEILLADNSQLIFMQWMKSELDAEPYVWDGGVVEISVDNGSTYQMLTPEGGYPKLIVDNPDSPFSPDTPCFGGAGGWEQVVVDLSGYAGKEAMIRFRFGADLFVVDEGWYIDDVKITPLSVTNDTHDWLTLNVTAGNVPATASPLGLILSANTTNLPPRYSDALMLAVQANDPLTPLTYIPVSLQLESRPQLEFSFAKQTSIDGSGIVTISNTVFDLDYDACGIELLYSLDQGTVWTNITIAHSYDEFGSVIISNDVLPQLKGIITTNSFGGVTNGLFTIWETTNSTDAILLATNVIISCRAWDGKYWSDSVTSMPFIVDNEPPTDPFGFTATSHDTGIWSTDRTFMLNWSASDDGDGVGMIIYEIAVTNKPILPDVVRNLTIPSSATVDAEYDGTNLWAVVAARDKFGNSSDTMFSGPYMVDSLPPSAQLTDVQFIKNAFGNYVIGTEVECSWSGFSDDLSGISGYHIATTNSQPTTNDNWISQSSATVSNVVPDQTNNVYVWAVDNAGSVSVPAVAPVLMLSEQNDYDGDGLDNGGENIAGTDASNAESVFSINEEVMTVASNSYLVISWDSITNRFYTLFNTSNLNGNIWSVVPPVSNAPGISGTMTYTNNLEGSEMKFYKVRVNAGE